jgi:hypothetical protein
MYPNLDRMIDIEQSFTSQVKQVVNYLYVKNRDGIAGALSTDSLTPFQISRIDQLDAEYRDIQLNLDRVNQDQIISADILSALQNPVTSWEIRGILAFIMAVFDLTTNDMADILRVDRQTIFAWIRNEKEPDCENSFRIRLIEKLAQNWNKVCQLPAKKVLNVILEEGTSLWSELCRKDLDCIKIITMMASAAQLINDRETNHKKDEIQRTSDFLSEYDFITLNAFVPKESE